MFARSTGRAGASLGAAAVILVIHAAPVCAHGITELVSVGPHGVQGNASSGGAAISLDGRFVAFASDASNLVPSDTNGSRDVFVRDRQTGTTRRVSLGPGGVQSEGGSDAPAISADGRFVAFQSDASNLIPGDTNGLRDVFVRDRQTGTTRRISLSSGGVQSNGDSDAPAISADGRFVAFRSVASNLVPGDANGFLQVFVRNRQTGTTRRVSLGPGGVQGNGNSDAPAISADGRLVAFASNASNLVRGDTNGFLDVFVRDRQRGTTERASLGPGGAQGNESSGPVSAISSDGRFVAFGSFAANLVSGDTPGFLSDVFVRDRQTRTIRRVSLGPGGVPGNGSSGTPAISADGRLVAFTSDASNLVRGDTNDWPDVFVRDLWTGMTRRVSLGPSGVQGNAGSDSPAISAHGRLIAFRSDASNLVPGIDANGGGGDAFIRITAP